MKSCGSKVILSSCLVLFFIVSFAVCVPGDLYDNRTGNKQAQQALNAALFRFRASGGLETLKNKWFGANASTSAYYRDSPDSYCDVPNNLIESVFPYPSNPAGTLKNILTRGYWLMASTFEDDGPSGNFSANPPYGYVPDADSSLVRLIGENYGVNLHVQYYLTDPSLGSGPVFPLILDGTVDSSNNNFAIGITGTLSNGTVFYRRNVFATTCSVINSVTDITVKASLGVSSMEELVNLIDSNSQLIIGTQAGGNVATVQSLWPNNVVRDYSVYAPEDPIGQLGIDLENGSVVAAFGFESTDFGSNSTDLISFSSGVSVPGGFLLRQDLYSPDYVPPQSACCSGTHAKNKGTNINFNFDGMLRGV